MKSFIWAIIRVVIIVLVVLWVNSLFPQRAHCTPVSGVNRTMCEEGL